MKIKNAHKMPSGKRKFVEILYLVKEKFLPNLSNQFSNLTEELDTQNGWEKIVSYISVCSKTLWSIKSGRCFDDTTKLLHKGNLFVNDPNNIMDWNNDSVEWINDIYKDINRVLNPIAIQLSFASYDFLVKFELIPMDTYLIEWENVFAQFRCIVMNFLNSVQNQFTVSWNPFVLGNSTMKEIDAYKFSMSVKVIATDQEFLITGDNLNFENNLQNLQNDVLLQKEPKKTKTDEDSLSIKMMKVKSKI